jgi:hypothetical protein
VRFSDLAESECVCDTSLELIVSRQFQQVVSEQRSGFGTTMSRGSNTGKHGEDGASQAVQEESPSSPRQPCHRDGRWRVIERVVEKTMAGIVFPMLTCTNYTNWSLTMCVNLQAASLWEAIQYGAPDYRDDKTALAALLHAVPVEMQASIAVKESAHDAWETIRRLWVGADRVREANVEQLCQEFVKIKFKQGETVEEFNLHITALANELRVLGDNITDKEVVKKMLHSVPDNLEQVAISMETLLDLNSLSIEEAVGHLRAVEQRKKNVTSPSADASGHLLLMKEDWTACMKPKEKGGSSGGGVRGKGRGRGRG